MGLAGRRADASWYVVAVVVVSLLALAAIVVLAVLRPLADNTLPILIIGFVAPTLAALLSVLRGQDTARAVAATNDQVVVLHDLVNSRLTELLKLTAAAARAEGVIAGAAVAVAPVVVVAPAVPGALGVAP